MIELLFKSYFDIKQEARFGKTHYNQENNKKYKKFQGDFACFFIIFMVVHFT